MSTRVLTTVGWLALSWLSTSGCRQLPPGQQQGTVAAQAGAAAKGMMANSAQKTTTGKNAMAAGAGADAAKSGGPDKMTAAGNPTTGAAGAAAPAASAAGAAPKANPKAIPACEGKVDEQVCDDVTLYHCVNGAYEGRAQACKTAAQCQAGLTTGQCGECDPGTFQCLDIELQTCDPTGTWVLAMECASAKLCKEDMGLCDTQVCHEGEYQCLVDQLQTCNRDFSDWVNEGRACDPGLCSKEAQGCLECLPNTAAACSDERTLTGCTADGKLDPQPCGKDTPFCAEAKCVQCNTAADCGASMNECGTLTCNAGVCAAGDPQPKGTACSSNGGKMCDFLGSCVTCVTDLDCNDSTKRCLLQSQCVTKNAITATALFSTFSVTVSPGFKAEVSPPTGVTGVPPGGELNSSQATDVTYLLGITGYSACGFTQIAPNDGSKITLQFSKDATDSMGTGAVPCGQAKSITLTAHKTTP